MAGLLVLAGPPGIGKSRRLGECAEHARCLVLASRAGEFERDGLLVDAVEDYLASLPADALEPLGADRATRLAVVLPALAPWDRPGRRVGPVRPRQNDPESLYAIEYIR